MSYDMLGELSLSEVRGPRDDLEEKLASQEGRVWLEGLKRFLRKENPWGNGTMQAGVESAIVVPTNHIIACSRPFDPAAFIGGGWTIWKGPADGNGLEGEEEQDVRSLALTEVDFDKVLFETCLKEGEPSITGEEKFKRLIEGKQIRLDARFAQALYKEPKHVTLKWLYKTKKISWMEFSGTTLRYPRGSRYWLCLCRRDGRWDWNYFWLGTTAMPRPPLLLSQIVLSAKTLDSFRSFAFCTTATHACMGGGFLC